MSSTSHFYEKDLCKFLNFVYGEKSEANLLIGSLSTLYITVFLIYILRPLDLFLEEFSRFLALFGLLSLFVSSIMAAFTREIFQVLGKPFKKVHHIIALTALGLITFHPIFVVIFSSDVSLFLPNFGSLSLFMTYAGAPSLYLILLATLAGYFQRKIPKFWRYIHGLSYVALIFGVIHGIKIGGHFSSSIALKIIYILMLVLTTFAFGFKRYRNYKKKRRIREKQAKKKEKDKIM